MKKLMKSEITIPLVNCSLKANLNIPTGAESIIIFSNGCETSRLSPGITYIADILNKEKYVTLNVDLLTEKEFDNNENLPDVHLLTRRLIGITTYTRFSAILKHFTIGYLGTGTGTAFALNAAEHLNGMIHAVVSHDGRPDLAKCSLSDVEAATLLIVGSLNHDILVLNQNSYIFLNCEKGIKIIDGASHLFESDKLNEVADLAVNWFNKYLTKHIHQNSWFVKY